MLCSCIVWRNQQDKLEVISRKKLQRPLALVHISLHIDVSVRVKLIERTKLRIIRNIGPEKALRAIVFRHTRLWPFVCAAFHTSLSQNKRAFHYIFKLSSSYIIYPPALPGFCLCGPRVRVLRKIYCCCESIFGSFKNFPLGAIMERRRNFLPKWDFLSGRNENIN